MILVDSSVWIDYLNGIDRPHTIKMKEVLAGHEIVTTELVIAEVLQGFRSRAEFEATRKLLAGFRFETAGGRHIAVKSARNYAYLRSLGFTVRKTIDSIIATKCIESGIELLHNDRDFIPFENFLGLRSISY